MSRCRNALFLGGSKLTVRKSFSIFICIVILTAMALILFSIDSSTFDVLKRADPKLLCAAAALVVCVWLLDSFKFITLARAAGERLTLRQTLAVIWINYFGSAITPMQSGGGPFQIYLLYRHGVSVGKSVAITLVRTLEILFLLALVVPFSILSEPDFLGHHVVLKWFVVYVVLFMIGAVLLMFISVLRPQWIKKGSNWCLVKLKRVGVLNPARLLYNVRKVNREIDNYGTDIRLFMSTGRPWFLLSIVFAILHLWVYMSIMPCLIAALGFEVRYMQCMLAESLFLFLLYFVPTPGAAGAAEGGAAAVFGIFVPWNLAGVMAVAWRLISEYTGVALGTAVVVKLIGWGCVDSVMREEGESFAEKDHEDK